MSLLPAVAWGEFAGLPYTEATFKARKLTLSLESTLQLRTVPSMDDQWITSSASGDHATFRSAAAGAALLIDLSHAVLGMRSRTLAWIDPRQGTALQRITSRTSVNGTRYRGARYADTGVEILRSRVGKGVPANWAEARTSYRPYPEWAGKDVAVTDPAALFYLLADPDLSAPGDNLQFHVLSSGKLLLVEVRVVDVAPVAADFIRISGGKSVRARAKREALVFNVDARHLDPGSSEDDMELFGMKGDLELAVDAAWRVPLRLAGRIPRIGRVSLELKAVTLR